MWDYYWQLLLQFIIDIRTEMTSMGILLQYFSVRSVVKNKRS